VKRAPLVLAILSLPAAALGFAISTAILNALSLPSGVAQIAILFVPIFVAGLCMVPFVAPALDQMAKRDLAAHRAAQAAAAEAAAAEANPDNQDAPKS
jgi:hypothetical protein